MILNQQNWTKVGDHKVKLVKSGPEFFRLHEQMILAAQKEIHLHTYIFEPDVCGMRMISCLRKAAQNGVKVFILLDRFGSKVLQEVAEKWLNHENIKFRFFGFLFSDENPSPGRRLHHKILTVDDRLALVGGINIAGKYKGTPKEKPWLDYAVAVESDSVVDLVDWCKAFEEKRVPEKRALTQRNLRWLLNDGFVGRREILSDYKDNIGATKEEIVLVSSYFLPGASLRRAIRKASRRGVKIKILLGAISDVPIMGHATNYLLGFLMKYKVEVYFWNQTVLHAKVACFDRKVVSIGSYNLNNLSSLLSIEVNAKITDSDFAAVVLNELNQVFSLSLPADPKEYDLKRKSMISRFRDWFSFKLMKWTLGFFRFLPNLMRPFSGRIDLIP